MEEIAQLAEQIRLIAETNRAQLERMDQGLKLLDERSQSLAQTEDALKTAIENLEITDEAHKQALDDLDGQLDDLAKVTAALLLIQKNQQPGAADESGV